MSKIKQLYQDIIAEIRNHPGYESALEKISKLELELIKLLSKSGDDWKQDREQAEAEVMKKNTGHFETISGLLDILSVSLNEITAITDIEEIMIKLGIYVRQLDGVILPNGEGGTHALPQISRDKKNGYNKFGSLLNVLMQYGIYADDLIIFSGNPCSSMSRNSSYVCVGVPRIKKTILINNDYGHATIVLDGIVNEDDLLNLSKNDIVSKYNGIKIFFSKKDILFWRETLRQAIFGVEKIDVVGKKVNVKDLQKFKDAIKQQFPSPEEFMSLDFKTLRRLKFYDKGLLYIANSIFGLRIGEDLISKNMAKLAVEIYGESDYLKFYIDNKFAKNYVISFIKSKYHSAELFMEQPIDEALEFKINGKGLLFVMSNIFDIYDGKFDLTWSLMAKLAVQIYGESDYLKAYFDNEFARDYISKKIKSLYPTEKDFMDLSLTDIENMKINGRGFVYIARVIFGLTIKNISARYMAIFAEKIYGESFFLKSFIETNSEKEYFKQQIKAIFPRVFDFMKLEIGTLKTLKIRGKGFYYLMKIVYEIPGFRNMSIKNQALFAEKIYGKSHYLKFFLDNEFAKFVVKEKIFKKFPTRKDFDSAPILVLRDFSVNGVGMAYIFNVIYGLKVKNPTKKTLSMLADLIYK